MQVKTCLQYSSSSSSSIATELNTRAREREKLLQASVYFLAEKTIGAKQQQQQQYSSGNASRRHLLWPARPQFRGVDQRRGDTKTEGKANRARTHIPPAGTNRRKESRATLKLVVSLSRGTIYLRRRWTRRVSLLSAETLNGLARSLGGTCSSANRLCDANTRDNRRLKGVGFTWGIGGRGLTVLCRGARELGRVATLVIFCGPM